MNLLQGKWPRLATLLAVLVAAALVFLAWERYTRTPWTRDARVRADVVTLSADVSGLITRLPLSDNQPVEKGELLLSIDPARYELAVLRAERAVNVARAALGESRAAIEASQAQLRQRRSEAQRRSALQKRSMLSVEENEKAQTDVSLAQAELLRNQASLGLAQANVELAEAALQQARLDLERTQVRAPVSGYVTNLQTREGDYAHAGVLPAYRCNGVLAVAEMARAGLGLAAIPAYLLRDGDGLRVLDADLEGCASALWLLTRPDCRALRSVVALFDELGRHVRLGDE